MGSSASSLAGKREVKSLSREGGGIEIYAEDKGGATPKVLRSGTKVPGRLSSVVSIETVEAERLLNEDVKIHDDENIYEIIEANVCDSSDEELDREDSDDENEEENLHEARNLILADAAALGKLASDFLHPEFGVSHVHPTCFGRNYFDRSISDAQNVHDIERIKVLEETRALKKLASDYYHPEVGVTATDPTCFGRNYFNGTSEVEDVDEEERAQVLAEAVSLKKLASDYHHPEVGVTNGDPTCFGRNYFNGTSDGEEVDEEERAQIIAEAAALKKLASDYHHPEVGVTNTDPTCFGRNYFNVSEVEEDDDEERAQVLAEATSLKQLASDYHHPEVGVTNADPTCFGRNYFHVASDVEEVDEEERAQILAEAAALKKLASDYHHPEVGVTNTDPTCFGRNYFNGTSEAEDVDEEERAQVLAEAAALKKLASDYYHPEVGVTVTDPTCFGRNYFNGTSDIGEVDEEERAQILAEAAALKKLASDHYHPEVGATSSDPTCFGRNYFDRDSEVAEVDEEERAQILAEAASLKKLASDYHHPEIGVTSTDPTCRGRNFYTRSTAVESSDDYVKRVLSDAAALRKYALDHHHPEIKVQTTDPMCFARNFFSRSSVGDDGEIVVYNEPQYVEEAYSNFEFDEDVNNEETLGNLKDAVYEIGLHDDTFQDKDEGNLSRSPSSVMLFEEC